MAQLRNTVFTLEQALSVRGPEIEQLKLQLAKLKRMQFGRKSEKIDRKIEQLETRLEDLVAEEGANEQQAPPSAPRRAAHRNASHCRNTFHARNAFLSPTRQPVANVGANSNRLARMFRSSSKSSTARSR